MTYSSTIIPIITECVFAHKSHAFCSLLLELQYLVLKEQSKSVFAVLRKFIYARPQVLYPIHTEAKTRLKSVY